MSAYADTSFLLSTCIQDANSRAAGEKMKTAELPLLVTELGELELINAVGLRLFRTEITTAEASAALSLFQKDIENTVVRVAPLSAGAFEHGKQIARTNTPVLGTRALDVLHVASALALRADTFYTFDRNQAKLAAAHGLRVL
ncbi:MAG TPA: type II toxin-antitoxin system VapC family toxin [Candidatus Acidoferrales bacterium]